MTTYTTTLKEKLPLTDSMYQLIFTKPEGFTHEPGQFVRLFFTDPTSGKVVPRSYSLCSLPIDDHIELLVKILENGVASEHFLSMEPGDTLEMSEAQGRFTCNMNAECHSFVATGSGLAPVVAMVRHLVEDAHTKSQVQLIFGVRHQSDLFWVDRMTELVKQAPDGQIIVTLTQPPDSWTGTTGRVTEHMDEIKDGSHVYLCGSAPMVMDMRKGLMARGFAANQMHFEIF